MNELAGLTKKLEYLFLRIIIKGVRDKKLTLDQARQYSQVFLKIEPFNSIDDARVKMNKFAAHNPQFHDLVKYVDAHVSEKTVESKVRAMRKLLKENKIEEVLKIAAK